MMRNETGKEALRDRARERERVRDGSRGKVLTCCTSERQASKCEWAGCGDPWRHQTPMNSTSNCNRSSPTRGLKRLVRASKNKFRQYANGFQDCCTHTHTRMHANICIHTHIQPKHATHNGLLCFIRHPKAGYAIKAFVTQLHKVFWHATVISWRVSRGTTMRLSYKWEQVSASRSSWIKGMWNVEQGKNGQ